jgi:hypothetical protein
VAAALLAAAQVAAHDHVADLWLMDDQPSVSDSFRRLLAR